MLYYYTAPIPHHSCGRTPIFIHPYLPTTDLVYLADPSLSPKNPLIYCTNTSQKMVTNHTILILHSLYVVCIVQRWLQKTSQLMYVKNQVLVMRCSLSIITMLYGSSNIALFSGKSVEIYFCLDFSLAGWPYQQSIC